MLSVYTWGYLRPAYIRRSDVSASAGSGRHRSPPWSFLNQMVQLQPVKKYWCIVLHDSNPSSACGILTIQPSSSEETVNLSIVVSAAADFPSKLISSFRCTFSQKGCPKCSCPSTAAQGTDSSQDALLVAVEYSPCFLQMRNRGGMQLSFDLHYLSLNLNGRWFTWSFLYFYILKTSYCFLDISIFLQQSPWNTFFIFSLAMRDMFRSITISILPLHVIFFTTLILCQRRFAVLVLVILPTFIFSLTVPSSQTHSDSDSSLLLSDWILAENNADVEVPETKCRNHLYLSSYHHLLRRISLSLLCYLALIDHQKNDHLLVLMSQFFCKQFC